MENNLNQAAIAEVIAIGNEILIGKTLDSNTNWLIKKLTNSGVFVKRAFVVRDNINDITEALHLALEAATLIITTGGLGPTIDDLTLEAVSHALNIPMEVNTEALKMVRERYHHFYDEGFIDSKVIIPTRKKMAILPSGGSPIYNSVGAAPGVLLNHEKALILMLPGVPKEMEAVFEEVAESIKSRIGRLENLEVKEIGTNTRDESKLAPILKSIQKDVNGVFLKSLATHFGKHNGMKIRIIVNGNDKKIAEEKIEKVEKLLAEKYSIKLYEE